MPQKIPGPGATQQRLPIDDRATNSINKRACSQLVSDRHFEVSAGASEHLVVEESQRHGRDDAGARRIFLALVEMKQIRLYLAVRDPTRRSIVVPSEMKNSFLKYFSFFLNP